MDEMSKNGYKQLSLREIIAPYMPDVRWFSEGASGPMEEPDELFAYVIEAGEMYLLISGECTGDSWNFLPHKMGIIPVDEGLTKLLEAHGLQDKIRVVEKRTVLVPYVPAVNGDPGDGVSTRLIYQFGLENLIQGTNEAVTLSEGEKLEFEGREYQLQPLRAYASSPSS
jgi:hypothetical protein